MLCRQSLDFFLLHFSAFVSSLKVSQSLELVFLPRIQSHRLETKTDVDHKFLKSGFEIQSEMICHLKEESTLSSSCHSTEATPSIFQIFFQKSSQINWKLAVKTRVVTYLVGRNWPFGRPTPPPAVYIEFTITPPNTQAVSTELRVWVCKSNLQQH